MLFFEKKCPKICTYQKKAVPLHPLSEKALLNGVMVALQILVLSVWVRVLVEQHEETFGSLFLLENLLISKKSCNFAADLSLQKQRT